MRCWNFYFNVKLDYVSNFIPLPYVELATKMNVRLCSEDIDIEYIEGFVKYKLSISIFSSKKNFVFLAYTFVLSLDLRYDFLSSMKL